MAQIRLPPRFGIDFHGIFIGEFTRVTLRQDMGIIIAYL